MWVLFCTLGLQASTRCKTPLGLASPPVHHNAVLDAPNVWQLQMPPAALGAARRIFDEAIRPHCTPSALDELETQLLPCRGWQSNEHGRFFIMKAGSSTDASLVWASDLAWVSVDDARSFAAFSDIFDATGARELVAPLVDTAERVRLYSSFFVVRSRCALPNLHTDWDDAVGQDAFTLLTPLGDYSSPDFQLLYEDYAATLARGVESGAASGDANADALRQYRYREGEALVFTSRFFHSTQPGRSVEPHGAPHVYLCFTFGTDKPDKYESTVAPTISGYQSRMLVDAAGAVQLTALGEHLRADGEGSSSVTLL